MKPRRVIELQALKIITEIQDWIRARDKVNVYLNFKAEDRLRLLRLRTWEYIYKIPISEILDIIVPAVRVHSNLRSKRYGLGTSISSITGFHAERILSVIVGRKYPDKENVGFWREAERDRQLYAEKLDELEGVQPREERFGSMLDMLLTDGAIERYVAASEEKRQQMCRAETAAWRVRRHYRGNPWIAT